MLRPIFAEFYKLRSSLALFLTVGLGILIAGFIFLGHSIDVHSMAILNIDPWEKYFNRSVVILSFLSICPFAIILVSGVLYIENNANAWKYLYTSPISRLGIYFSKLLVILILFLAGILLFIAFVTASGYILNIFHPEYELAYSRPNIWRFLKSSLRFMVASLGIIGIQYFITRQFKNILIPTGIGFFGYIASLLISVVDTRFALFVPYTYPMLCEDLNTFTHEHRVFYMNDSISNYEVFSISVFVAFVLIGAFIERRRTIS